MQGGTGMYDVIALGELLIDFAAKETDADGYPTMKANPGGAPGNFLAALNKYGMKTAFLGKVGDDTFGKLLLKTFKKAGIETKGILTDPSVFTTLAFVTFSPEGDRSFSFARKPGADTRLSFEEIDLKMIDEASVFHFGTLSLTDDPVRTATKKCVEYAKEHGKLITFDPNLRLPLWETPDAAKGQILWGLAHADVVKISDEEVKFLWGITDEKEAAKKLLDEFGIRFAMVTMGPKGAYLANKSGAVYAKCPEVKPVVNLCPEECERFFKRMTGMTLFQYLIEYRITKSREFLADHSFTIAEIAQNTGFSSQSYFTSCFKKFVGCTPNKYRKK